LQGYGRGCLSRWSWGWLASPSGLSIDEKALGVGVAAVALALRAPFSSPRWSPRLLGSS
jgi:hypothetical protein